MPIPYAALAFYWIELDRQIRISGKAEKTSREESQTYFHSRPVGSQLSAWASRQSQVLDGRRVLDARMAEMTERFGDKRIPLPPHWGGYRVKPDTIEFLARSSEPAARSLSLHSPGRTAVG